MRTIYEIDGNNIYTGNKKTIGDNDGRPMGWVDSSSEPPYGISKLVLGQWVSLNEYPSEPVETKNHIGMAAEKRYEKEVAGIIWRGFIIATDRDSQSKLQAEKIASIDSMRDNTDIWKCYSLAENKIVFRVTTNDEIFAIADCVYDYVRACFRRESEINDLAEITDEDISTGWPERVFV